jgi:hypothetical protein
MPLDAVSHLNPGWKCWHTNEPMNGSYHAERKGYGRIDAADPEDLHTQILIAESRVVHPLPQPAYDFPSHVAVRPAGRSREMKQENHDRYHPES